MSISKAVDLLPYIALDKLECLNQQKEHSIINAIQEGLRDQTELYLESDTDEQLLIHFPFRQTVKIHSFEISGPDDGSAPKNIKFFVNYPTIGFSEATDVPGVQNFELSPNVTNGEILNLKFVKFQAVNNLTVFIESNQNEEDTTKIIKIKINGFPGEIMNVSEIKKENEEN